YHPHPPPPPTTLRHYELSAIAAESLDLGVDAGGKVELHQRVHRLRRGIENVHQPLVRANLELLAGFLIDVWRLEHGDFILHGRQWNRTCHASAGAFSSFDDFSRRLVEHAIIVSFQANSDLVVKHNFPDVRFQISDVRCQMSDVSHRSAPDV